MDGFRKLEELRYQNKRTAMEELSCRIHPTAMETGLMRGEYVRAGKDRPFVFTDIRVADDGWFFLIYIWDRKRYGDREYKCFINASGCRMDEAEEEELLLYCTSKDTLMHEYSVQQVVKELERLAPEQHIEYYGDKPLYTVLHIYFCMFRGLRELLYKAKLPYLATAIDKIEHCNLLPVLTSGSPTGLFESGFTMKLLKLLDNEWGIRELMEEENRKLVAATYRKYSRNLGGYSHITQSQWEYLKACFKERFLFDRKRLRFFAADKTARLYEDYLVFQAKRILVNRAMNWPGIVSSGDELYRCMEEADFRIQYLENRAVWDGKMRRQKSRLRYLDYRDDQYLVCHPNTIEDIFREGYDQGNCLRTMYMDIARGGTDIGFMRKAEDPEHALITFEVRRGKVRQIYGKHNQRIMLNSQEFQWFSSVYMKEKGFVLADSLRDYYSGNHAAANDFILIADDEELPFN